VLVYEQTVTVITSILEEINAFTKLKPANDSTGQRLVYRQIVTYILCGSITGVVVETMRRGEKLESNIITDI
jgi:hypothetical protein